MKHSTAKNDSFHRSKGFLWSSILAVVFLLAACNPKKFDTSGMAQEMRDRQLKHITPSQMTALASEWGQQVSDSLAKKSDPQSVKDLSERYGAEIRLVPFDSLKSLSPSDVKEKEVLEAYRFAVEEHQPVSPNLQKLANGEIWLYTQPLTENDAMKGLWMIRFTRKSLILRLDTKTLDLLKTPE